MAKATAALSVRLQAMTGDFDKKMKKSSKNVDKMRQRVSLASKAFKKMALAVGAAALALVSIAAVRGFARMIRATLDSTDALGKYAQRLGIATEELHKLQFAAKLTAGVAESTLNMALQRMTRRLSEAAQGTGEAINAIKELGLSAEALSRLTPDKQFHRIADAMRKVTSQADRVRLSFKLFDSEGVALVNTLMLGSKGLDEFGRKLEATGGLITEQMAQKAADANDALEVLNETTKALGVAMTISLAPGIAFAAESLGLFVTEMNAAAAAANSMSTLTFALLAFIEALRGIRIAFNFVQGAVGFFLAGIAEMIAVFVKGVDLLLFGLIPNTVTDFLFDFAREIQKGAIADFAQAEKSGQKSASAFERFKKFQEEQTERFRQSRRAAKEAAEAAGRAAKEQIGGIAAITEEAAEAIKKTAELLTSTLDSPRKLFEQAARFTFGGMGKAGGGMPDIGTSGGGGGARFKWEFQVGRENKKQSEFLQNIRDILKRIEERPPELVFNEVGI